jgi:hypothetical protein
MDPVTLIISTLTAGAVAALQETAGTAIKDAYQGLTTLIKMKFTKDADATAALKGLAEDPKTWQKPLENSIKATGVADDAAILAAAQKLSELIQSQKSGPKYNVDIKGDVQGLVQGDHAKVTMSFDKPTRKRKRR